MVEKDLIRIEDAVWVLMAPTGLPFYDFEFCRFFDCRHPWQRLAPVTAVARAGAINDYDQRYQELAHEGISLVHSPDEHLRCSELPAWYGLLEDLTPKSIWFDAIPTLAEVSSALRWPIFVKGQRQTSRHKRSLSIITGPDAFQNAMEVFQQDPILSWQKIVFREYVPLRPVEDPLPDRIPSSFEFRTFWWKGELVGLGRYWWEGKRYEMTDTETLAAVAVAREATIRVHVQFLVVDVAQRKDGGWIVIECNDGQESGYAGVPPVALWQNVIEIEKRER